MATTIHTGMNLAPAPYVIQPQNVVIAREDPHPASRHRTVFRNLGITQLVFGGIGFILGIALYALPSYYSGTGIWGGIFYFLSGGCAVSIGVRAHQCNVITGLITSIIASIIGFVSGLVDATAAATWVAYAPLIYNETEQPAVVGLHAVLSLFGFIQMILAITVSAYCCMGTCGHNNVQGQVIGTTTFVTVPVVQQGYGQQQYYPQPVGAQVYTNVAAQPQPINPPAYEVQNEKI